jgi:outer membrane protein TolC
VIGPFSVFDARVAAKGPLLDLHALNLLRARTQDVKAAQLDYQNTRDLIVLVVGGTYMEALAGEARIASAEAQVNTSQTLYQQAVDMRNAGVVARIDVLRAQVELQVQQQRLLATRNDFAKQKLALARLIGLPTGQEFSLAQQIPFALAPPLALDQALDRAYHDRPDYQGAKVLVESAQLEKKAASAEALPSIEVNADYGVLGQRPTQAHGTFTTAAALRIPIFQGGKVRGDVLEAQALLNRRQAELDDLRGRIEFEVRSAFLDLQSAADQVQVAKSSVDLAHQTLTQAQDRFRAGVTNNIEVVQAQEAIATTDENFIASTFSYNIAKLSLVRALGIAEHAVKGFLGGKP